MTVRFGLPAALVVSFMVTACAGATGGASPNSAQATPASLSSESTSGGVGDRPWATASLINVATGKPFRLTDVVASGKVVFIETMAIWCSNCRAQQVEAKVAFEAFDPARVEWVAIDVESSETAEALARYREQNGFPFTYSIADAEFARALVAEFGDIVLSPPSVNIIVIGADGRITALHGHKSADELRSLAAEHGAT